MRAALSNLLSGADLGTSPVLAAAVTRSLTDAVAAFIAATDHNGAFAPKALRELIQSEPLRLTLESIGSAIAVANATAHWRAGGTAAWPNCPASIAAGPPMEILGEATAFILNAVAQAGGPARSAYDKGHWTAYAFGSGRSRVALLAPWLPHPNDRNQLPIVDQYAVVAYLIEDDESPREETWGYRIAPIKELRRRSSGKTNDAG